MISKDLGRPNHRGVSHFYALFRTAVWVILCPLRIAKEGLTQGQRLNLTALRHNHLNWKKAYKLHSVWSYETSLVRDETRTEPAAAPQLIHTNVNGSIFRYIMLPFHLMVSLIPLLPKFKLCKFCYTSGTIQREKQRKIPAPKMVSFFPSNGSANHTQIKCIQRHDWHPDNMILTVS